MSKLAELQEKRNALAKQIREFGDRFNSQGKKWKDGEEAKTWEKLNADYDAVMAEMDQARNELSVSTRLEQVAALQDDIDDRRAHAGLPNARNGRVGNRRVGGDGSIACTDEHRALAIAGWMRNQYGEEPTARQRNAARIAGIRLGARQLVFDSLSTIGLMDLQHRFNATHPARRTPREFLNAPFTTQTAGTGGNVVMPQTMLAALEVNLLAFGGMRQVAELIVTESGEPLQWPTVNDTGNTGVQIGENTDLANSGAGGPVPTFAKVQWSSYKLSSQAMLVPYELLEDAVVDLPVVLGQMAGERIGRLSNTRYTTGTGSSQAKGIVTAATLGVTAAGAAAITFDEIINLEHSVDPAYRNGAGYMCRDSTVLYLRKLKDSNGQYLWQSGANTGTPDLLNNRPLTVNQDVAAIATGNKTVLFGQLGKYKIRRVNGIRFYRLEERYRDTDQDGFIMLVREDGNLLDAGTAPVKYLQQA